MNYWNNKVKKLLSKQENKECADCGSKFPKWVSINIGCFLCMKCAGIHRSIGVHITRIQSITLDVWTKEQYNFLDARGNVYVNSLYEADIGFTTKPTINTSNETLSKYIIDKYVNRIFYRARPEPPPPQLQPTPTLTPTQTPIQTQHIIKDENKSNLSIQQEVPDLIDLDYEEPIENKPKETITNEFFDFI